MTEIDDLPDRGYDAALLRRLLVYLRPYWGLTIFAVFLLLAGAGLALVGPALTQGVLDELAKTGELPRVAVAVTGHDEPAVRERCLNAGCRAVLVKPISATQLPALIKVWLAESDVASQASVRPRNGA